MNERIETFPEFSVLMSVYIKETPTRLEECLKSITEQTIPPNEIVIVEDGKLTNELYTVLENIEKEFPKILKRIPLKENVGLGQALSIGVQSCSYPLIARMDTDDVAAPQRFEKQLLVFKNNPEIGLLGSAIAEFEGDVSNVVALRTVPLDHEDIVKHAKRRNPFNHMTVMYKKEEVIQAGNYQHLNGFEDYYLWVRMLKNGTQTKNLNEILVYARAGNEMFYRRGGIQYLKSSKLARKKIYEVGFNSYSDYLISMIGQVVVSIVPNETRAYIYKKLLRSNNSKK
ncbi:glycosyltransferase [Carnobacterium mobile]|uniref:glycosyltransferase n=1 Tax=Carnobacterium mobile TaxID=2750 RepID=UPI00054F989D|nr:glycosyltransferase [Carnobacterium mobile]